MRYTKEQRAESEAYLAALETATPEEVHRLVEEHKEKVKEWEKLWEQKAYNERKERFLKISKGNVAVFEELIRAAKDALKVIKTFDGKVLNNRLTNAVKEKFNKNTTSASLTIEYNHKTNQNEGKLKINVTNWSGASHATSIRIILSNPPYEERVVADKTEELFYENSLQQIEKYINQYKDAAKNYDKRMKKAMNVANAINEYAKVEGFLRDFWRAENVIRGTYYL